MLSPGALRVLSERNARAEFPAHFSNDMSSFSEKLVDFDIMVESEPRNIAPAKPTSMTEQSSSLEESIYKLSGSLSSIQRTQKCKFHPVLSFVHPALEEGSADVGVFVIDFRTRDHRNKSTVTSTSSRILYFSLVESAMMIGMSSFQVYIVRRFFSAPGKRRLV